MDRWGVAWWLEDEGKDAGCVSGDDCDEGVKVTPPHSHGTAFGLGSLHGKVRLLKILRIQEGGKVTLEG